MIYRILIVDDESVDLEWMEHRIRNSGKRLEVAAAVTSAPAALNVVRREPIDIILSDIQMPIMSGIELVREVKEIDDHIRVMFVSGYKEFEYAKQAVSFNAFGYLLKPVDNRELFDLLDTVIRSLDTERERKEETLQLKETFSLVKQELLFRWLENGDPQLAMQVVSSLDHEVQSHGAVAAIIEVDRIDWRKANENDEEWHSLYPQVIRFITKFVQDRGWGYCIQGEQLRRALILFGDESTHGSRADELIQHVQDVFPITITIGLGFHTYDPEELPQSYMTAKAAIGTKWLVGKNKTLTPSIPEMTIDAIDPISDEHAAKIVQALLDYDLIAIDDWLEELFYRFKRIDSKHEVYEHMVHSIVHLKEQLYAMNENFDSLMEWTAPFPKNMLEFDTLLDMKSWLRRNFFSLSERWYNKRNGQQRKLIDEIMHYVKEQIDKEITLKKTADHFGFNANYLGQLFKQETGQHFSNFIIEQRFNKACELLRDPTLKVYEIAERVGYKNIVYFNRLFKQSAGMSPGDYRKRLLI